MQRRADMLPDPNNQFIFADTFSWTLSLEKYLNIAQHVRWVMSVFINSVCFSFAPIHSCNLALIKMPQLFTHSSLVYVDALEVRVMNDCLWTLYIEFAWLNIISVCEWNQILDNCNLIEAQAKERFMWRH